MRRPARHYWAANAVLPLFIRDANSDFLIGVLKNSGPVYTSASTVTELRLGILKASQEGRLKPHGGEAIRTAFFDAVRVQHIVLIKDETESLVEAFPTTARQHIADISPITFRHLTLACDGGFTYFVTCNDKEASMCRDWGLRKIYPKEIFLPIDSFRDRVSRCRYLFSSLHASAEDLRSELNAASSDVKAVKNADLDAAFEDFSDELSSLDLHELEESLEVLETMVE